MALALRSFSIPTIEFTGLHALPFSLLALLSTLIFFSAGLYDTPNAVIRRELPGTILAAQIANIIIAALFFFFVPVFAIAPKVTLAVYLLTSVVLVASWRFAALSLSKLKDEHVVVIGSGEDTAQLLQEFSGKGLLPFNSIHVSFQSGDILSALDSAMKRNPVFVIADLDDPLVRPALPLLNKYEGEGRRLVDFSNFYERVFRRLPLSALSYRNFSHERSFFGALYDGVKRLIDIFFSIPLAILFFILLPFVYLAVRSEGPGPLFVRQERIGRNWQRITVTKFRTMRQNKSASTAWTTEEKTDNPVTKIGAFLRRTSIDELPQVFSVIAGDLSWIGPRSDIAGLGDRLSEALPSYRSRYAVTPGISGWAQVNQRYAPGNISPQSIDESRVRLTYDLYYVKYRSLFLDFSITLRTIKTLIRRLLP